MIFLAVLWIYINFWSIKPLYGLSIFCKHNLFAFHKWRIRSKTLKLIWHLTSNYFQSQDCNTRMFDFCPHIGHWAAPFSRFSSFLSREALLHKSSKDLHTNLESRDTRNKISLIGKEFFFMPTKSRKYFGPFNDLQLKSYSDTLF